MPNQAPLQQHRSALNPVPGATIMALLRRLFLRRRGRLWSAPGRLRPEGPLPWKTVRSAEAPLILLRVPKPSRSPFACPLEVSF